MAVGVRKDMLPVTMALSYWFQELRACNPTTDGSPCYNELNMEQIFNKWHNVVTCPTSKSGASSIDYVNFLYVFILCWVGAGCAFLWEISQLRFRDRMISVFMGSGLRECVCDGPFNAINPKTGVLSSNHLRSTFKAREIQAPSSLARAGLLVAGPDPPFAPCRRRLWRLPRMATLAPAPTTTRR